MSFKQVILVRQDLKMPKGKMAVQVAHASVDAVLNSDKSAVNHWKLEGMKKVVLKVKDKKELLHYHSLAKKQKIASALITDGARTFFKTPTTTCLAIGPEEEEIINSITGNLKML
jgi:PTH2 family peptidyl-tRNA hydrolase